MLNLLRSPKERKFECPNCYHKNLVIKNGDLLSTICDRCGEEIWIDFKNGMKLNEKGGMTLKQLEQCPECNKDWECWLNINGDLAQIHGAIYKPPGNRVACLDCGTLAKVYPKLTKYD